MPIAPRVMTNKTNMPIEEIIRAIIFKIPFSLNNAVKNEPSSNNNNVIMSHDSGKGFNTCGVIKPKTINRMNNTNESMLKYLLITSPLLSYIIGAIFCYPLIVV